MTNIARENLFDLSLPIYKATDFLSLRYQEVTDLFGNYERATSMVEKQTVASKICTALIINAHIEEDVFYPEVKKLLKEKGLISAAIMEHSILKYLVAEIQNLDADSAIYDIKIKVLNEHVKYQIKEKQNKLFPKVNASGKVDLWRLGAQVAARKSFLEISQVSLRG
jgi:hypothetical protein